MIRFKNANFKQFDLPLEVSNEVVRTIVMIIEMKLKLQRAKGSYQARIISITNIKSLLILCLTSLTSGEERLDECFHTVQSI
jgi:hypothetical protein